MDEKEKILLEGIDKEDVNDFVDFFLNAEEDEETSEE